MSHIRLLALTTLLFGVALLLAVGRPPAVEAGALPFVNVAAPAIDCHFAHSCPQEPLASAAAALWPGVQFHSGGLRVETLPQAPLGTPAAGLFTYRYRIDLTDATTRAADGCVVGFSLPVAGLVWLDYDGDDSAEAAYVIADGGLGSVPPASVDLRTETDPPTLGVTLATPLCLAADGLPGDASLALGVASIYPPGAAQATLHGSADAAWPAQTRAPQPPPADAHGYIHRVWPHTYPPDSQSRSYLDHPRLNDNPQALPIVSVNHTPDGQPTEPYGGNPALAFDVARGRWAIVAQDGGALPEGSAFNVLLANEADGGVLHVHAGGAPSPQTLLDHALLNDNPQAQPIAGARVTLDARDVLNDSPLAMIYLPAAGRWAIENANGEPIPAGAAFHVQTAGPAAIAFTHTVAAPGRDDARSAIDHPALNAQPQLAPHVVALWEVDGCCNHARAVGVAYDGEGDRWLVASRNGDPLPVGARFHIVLPAADSLGPAIARLAAASLTPPVVTLDGGAPVAVTLAVPAPPDANPAAMALQFLRDHADLYGLPDPAAQLYVERFAAEPTRPDFQHVIFGQRVGDVPVFAAGLGVHLEDGIVRETGGRWARDLPLQLTPGLTPQLPARAAEQIALAFAGELAGRAAARYGLQARFNLGPDSVVGDTSLWIYDARILGVGDGPPIVAWRVGVSAGAIARYFFVDALSGGVAFHYSDVNEGDRPGEDFEVEDVAGRGPSATCYWFAWERPTSWFTEDGALPAYPGAANDFLLHGQRTYDALHATYHMVYDRLGRRSWDGHGGKIYAVVHVGFANATYNHICGHMRFGQDNRGWVSDDIVGHEFAHGIVAHTANLVYHAEAGALNESYADLFGAYVDGNWLVGEMRDGNPDISGAIRDMQDPRNYGHPDRYSRRCTYDAALGGGDYCSYFADEGGVHTNSGIQNKVIYLLTDGDTHNGRTITALGRDKTLRLFYDVLRYRLTSGAQYVDAQSAGLAQAASYARSGQYGFTLFDVCQVRNAWAAVELGMGDSDCDGILDDIDDDGDNDGVRDAIDNCPTAPNSSQADSDRDGLGDACDNDIDGDGRFNGGDNCPTIANWGQGDFDNDDIGDVCDDSDSDGRMDSADNCRRAWNPDQSDADGDGIGDACDTDYDNDGHANAVDNCPLAYNAGQADSDGDGIGNVCDNCLAVSNPDQRDQDHDGKGDVCDADRDGDGFDDDRDNCPHVYNPDQVDLDLDGIGLRCDVDEAELQTNPYDLLLNPRFVSTLRPVRIPLDPCSLIDCTRGDWYRAPETVNLTLGLPAATPVRIVRADGGHVSHFGGGLDGSLAFTPQSALRYTPPVGAGRAAAAPFSATGYYLEIYPPADVVPGEPYPLTLSLTRDGVPTATTLAAAGTAVGAPGVPAAGVAGVLLALLVLRAAVSRRAFRRGGGGND